MNTISKIYQKYIKLSPTDEQVVFRDIMRRLHTPILNNWDILVNERDIKPEKEYIDTFDLKNREVIENIGEMEKETISTLLKAGIFKSVEKHRKKIKSHSFIFNKPLVYSFKFKVDNYKLFFELYNQIFKEAKIEKAKNDKAEIHEIAQEPKKKTVNTRETIEFNVKTGVLRFKETGKQILKCRAESIPHELLEIIFTKKDNSVRLRDLKRKISKATTVKNSIKGSIKEEVREILFIVDMNSLELKKEYNMEELLMALAKQKIKK